jgi:hypothetical protein
MREKLAGALVALGLRDKSDGLMRAARAARAVVECHNAMRVSFAPPHSSLRKTKEHRPMADAKLSTEFYKLGAGPVRST